MREAVQRTLGDDLIRQQAQCPPSRACGWVAATERDQLCLNVAGDLGRLSRTRLVVEGRSQASGIEPMQQQADRDRMDPDCLGDGFVGSSLALAPVCQQQDTRSGQSASGEGAGAGQLVKFGALLVGQRNGHTFAHGYILPQARISKYSLTKHY